MSVIFEILPILEISNGKYGQMVEYSGLHFGSYRDGVYLIITYLFLFYYLFSYGVKNFSNEPFSLFWITVGLGYNGTENDQINKFCQDFVIKILKNIMITTVAAEICL